jgi:hypothetical protein
MHAEGQMFGKVFIYTVGFSHRSFFLCDQHREVKICTELLHEMQEGGQDSRQPVATLNTVGHG